MNPVTFVLILGLLFVLALWGMAQMLFHTDPAELRNVLAVLALLFVAGSSLVTAVSWLIGLRLRGDPRVARALRHGAWGGIFVLSIPLLNWLNVLRPLVIGAVLLILVGVELLILLQHEATQEKAG